MVLEMIAAAFNKQALGHRWTNYWLLLLSNNLATFYDVPSTRGLHLSPFRGLTFSHVFSLHCRGSPPSPTNQPNASSCGIDEKLSKMVGN